MADWKCVRFRKHSLSVIRRNSVMEEPGEQCTVVFVLTVMGPVGECGGGDCSYPPSPHTLAGSVTIYAMTTLHCSPDSSMYSINREKIIQQREGKDGAR